MSQQADVLHGLSLGGTEAPPEAAPESKVAKPDPKVCWVDAVPLRSDDRSYGDCT